MNECPPFLVRLFLHKGFVYREVASMHTTKLLFKGQNQGPFRLKIGLQSQCIVDKDAHAVVTLQALPHPQESLGTRLVLEMILYL